MFNSALVYELAVLKQFAEPALFSVPRDSAEYVEAKRLLKFLDYFLGVGCENIPQNSILREFVDEEAVSACSSKSCAKALQVSMGTRTLT